MKYKIQISKETKKLISSFGLKGESFDTIIKRIYNLAVKQQLRDLLMSSENTITLEEARRRVNDEKSTDNN